MPTPIRDLECFVFDMDGTINLGETLIPGALELIQSLQARRIKFFFFTNNSSKAPEDYIKKLERLGFSGITRSHIMTSGDVMIHYLKTHFPSPKVFLAGTPALETQFAQAGIQLLPADARAADAAVLGFSKSGDHLPACLFRRSLPGDEYRSRLPTGGRRVPAGLRLYERHD